MRINCNREKLFLFSFLLYLYKCSCFINWPAPNELYRDCDVYKCIHISIARQKTQYKKNARNKLLYDLRHMSNDNELNAHHLFHLRLSDCFDSIWMLVANLFHFVCLSLFLGGIGLLWSALWFFIVFETPASHPRISREELEEIETAIGSSTTRKKPTYVPWYDIFTAPCVWAIVITHGTSVFGYFTIVNQLPTYMKEILHFDIKQVRIG